MAEKGGRQERLSPDYAANVRMMDDILRVRDNFDVIRKDMQIGRDRITLYYIDGFVKDSVMEKLMIFFLSLKRLVPEESGAPAGTTLRGRGTAVRGNRCVLVGGQHGADGAGRRNADPGQRVR